MRAFGLKNQKKSINIWLILAMLGVIITILPLLFMLAGAFDQPSASWQNIRQYVLGSVIINTAILVVFTAIFSAVLGVSLGIIMTLYSFKFKRLFSLLLMLPLAIPPYIAAFTYADFISFTGPFQSFFRNKFDISLAHISIMNLSGAIFIFSITLYPYIYIVTCAYLKNNSAAIIENARILGKNNWHSILKIVLPVLMPSVVVGITFVGLEVINDFGVANYFGIRTLSTLIFQAWHGMFDINLAIRISLTLVFFVTIYLILSFNLVRYAKYKTISPKAKPLIPTQLKGKAYVVILLFFLLVTFFGFFLPIGHMLSLVSDIDISQIWQLTQNTLYVSLIASTIIIIFGIIFANANRFATKYIKTLLRLASIGYAMPSAVLAIGVISLFVILEGIFNISFSFTLIMLIFALCVKYFALGSFNIEKGYTNVGTIYTESSAMLGFGPIKTFFKVDLISIKNFIISGFILVFIDLVKELPLTMTLRSFNFQTLSTRVYMFAINEQIAASTPYSLAIIFLCIVFIILANYIGGEWLHG